MKQYYIPTLLLDLIQFSISQNYYKLKNDYCQKIIQNLISFYFFDIVACCFCCLHIMLKLLV